MASVTLATLWLNAAANPADAMSFPYLSALKVTPSVNGAVRQYAAGRQRAVSQLGTQTPVAVTLPACSSAQVAWIDAHLNTPLMVRDDRGRKLWGQYFSYTADEHPYNGDTDITLTLSQISFDEAV